MNKILTKVIKKKILVKGGKVHDVGCRLHLLQKADELMIPNIGAWNIYQNGREVLKVLVGGEKEKVEEFILFVKESFPEEAKVEDIEIEDYKGEIPTLESFSRRFSTAQLSKIATAGVGMLKKQDITIKEIKKGFGEMGEKIDSGFGKTGKDFQDLRQDYGKIVEIMTEMAKSLKKMAEKS